MIFSTLSPAASVPEECTTLLSPSLINLSFSFFIFFGILISYLPQHLRIIRRGTSEGISPLFLFLGVTSGTCAFLNILILSWSVLGCCSRGIGGFNCFAASMGVAQVGLQWSCFAIILVLFLLYLPRGSQLQIEGSAPVSKGIAVGVAVLSLVHGVTMAAVTLYFTVRSPARLGVWAHFLGVQSTILASVQYIPQLYTTWRLKHVGSLSIPMMCIQTPGSFVWAVSLATREGTRWSSWVVYVVTGTLQGCLLAMCVMWEIEDRRARGKVDQLVDQLRAGSAARERAARERAEAGERQPLLAGER